VTSYSVQYNITRFSITYEIKGDLKYCKQIRIVPSDDRIVDSFGIAQLISLSFPSLAAAATTTFSSLATDINQQVSVTLAEYYSTR